MSTISAASVNELRKRTDMPLMDCKKALTETGGDMTKAIEWLRSQNSKMQAKRSMNETAEGRVAIAIDGDKAAIVEMRCESAPVTKSEHYIALGQDLAKAVLANSPPSVEAFVGQKLPGGLTVTERINEVIGLIRENMKVQRFQRLTGGAFGEYVHHDGTLGVLVQVSGGEAKAELLRDVGAHIAALNPAYAKTEDVPADILAKEKALALQQVSDEPKNQGKPANILEKIVEGKVKAWAGENVLLEQPMANAEKYQKKTVGEALKAAGLTLAGFVRYKVGEVAL